MIVTSINRYIDLDKERAAGLAQIDGKTIGIFVREFDARINLCVDNLSLQELADPDNELDVEIVVSLKALPDLLLGADQDQLIKRGDIEIKGDAHIASVFQNTLRAIEIDWEELLSKYTGDSIAYQIGLGVKGMHAFGHRLRGNMRQDLRDYLQDEVQVSATQDEVSQFVQEVDSVRAQADRLEARINRLHTRT